jgi:hypothetical protein
MLTTIAMALGVRCLTQAQQSGLSITGSVVYPDGKPALIDALVFNPKSATCAVCGYGCLYPGSIDIPGGTPLSANAMMYLTL